MPRCSVGTRNRLALPFVALLAACSAQEPSPPLWGTLEITPSSATLNALTYPGLRLVVTARDSLGNVLEGRSMTWSSSSKAIATVDTMGYVQAIAVGTANVTASSAGVSVSATITVEPVTATDVAGAWDFHFSFYFLGSCRGQSTIHVVQRPSDAAFSTSDSLPGCAALGTGGWRIGRGIATGVASNGRISFTKGECRYSGTILHTPTDSMGGSVSCAERVRTGTLPACSIRCGTYTLERLTGSWAAIRASSPTLLPAHPQ
jgi:hypothetical protein